MRREDLQVWLADPASIDAQATLALENALKDFPYSAILHQLYLKGLQNQQSYLATAQLKKTSMLTGNRGVLMEWVEGEDDRSPLEVPEAAKSIHKPAVNKPSSKPEPQTVSQPERKPQEENSVSKPPVDVQPNVEKELKAPLPKPVQPASKPAVQAKPTVLGDDLSHLPERVRAIVEKSRKLQSEYGHPHETDPKSEGSVAKTEDVEEAVESPIIEDVQDEPTEVADTIALEDQRSESEESAAEIVQEEKSSEDVEEPQEEVSAGTPLDLSALGALPPLVDVSSKEEVEESEPVQAEPEERIFARPIVLDDLTGDSQEEDAMEELLSSSVELDFVSWLKQKNQHEDETVADAPAYEFVMLPEEEVETKNPATEQKQEEKHTETRSNKAEERALKMDLIDRFIQEQPKIKPVKHIDHPSKSTSVSKPRIDVSAMGSEVGDDFITETLAQVYRQQGALEKALSAYEILRLKYPEKSSFFANQISELRRQIKKS